MTEESVQLECMSSFFFVLLFIYANEVHQTI